MKCANGVRDLGRLAREFRILASAGGLLGVLLALFSALPSISLLESEKGIAVVLVLIWLLTSLVWFLTSAFVILSGVYPALRRPWIMLTNIIAGLLEVFEWICFIAREDRPHGNINAIGWCVFLGCVALIIASTAIVVIALNTSEALGKAQGGRQAQPVQDRGDTNR